MLMSSSMLGNVPTTNQLSAGVKAVSEKVRCSTGTVYGTD
jgi:hypothetical protein